MDKSTSTQLYSVNNFNLNEISVKEKYSYYLHDVIYRMQSVDAVLHSFAEVAPPQKTQSPKSHVQRDTKSPSGGLRQSHTPCPRIQLEKTNSKNRFSVLKDEESMECGVLPLSPTSPTPDGVGQKPQQTPKPNVLSTINNHH